MRGKKIANGAFGQLRVGKDNDSGLHVAIKLESINARIPMLFLEHRFYKVKLSLLDACFDLILSPSPSMKIEIMGGKVTENLGFKSPLR